MRNEEKLISAIFAFMAFMWALGMGINIAKADIWRFFLGFPILFVFLLISFLYGKMAEKPEPEKEELEER